MGAGQGSILRIFVMAGGAIGALGTAAGLILGSLVSVYIDPIQSVVERRSPSAANAAEAPPGSMGLVLQPFWSPGLYYTHECPDLFKMGDWWYLVYSTFTERSVTHYRMSRSLHGPWQAPENDTFDGRAYYATKSAAAEQVEKGPAVGRIAGERALRRARRCACRSTGGEPLASPAGRLAQPGRTTRRLPSLPAECLATERGSCLDAGHTRPRQRLR
jgi:hypothetical protein